MIATSIMIASPAEHKSRSGQKKNPASSPALARICSRPVRRRQWGRRRRWNSFTILTETRQVTPYQPNETNEITWQSIASNCKVSEYTV